VTIKSVDAESGLNNRETVAWFDDRAIYIPKTRIREAAGHILKVSEIGRILSELDLLAEKPKPDRFCVRWIPRIGRVTAYALRRDEFGRSKSAFTVHQGGKDGD
jgi:hypothetical protein